MSAGRIDVDVTGDVATVTIANPAKRNAMTPAMWRQLPPLLDKLAADSQVRALVLTGSGETFCAGADISALGELREEDALAERALADFPKPTLAAIRGYCVGGGCLLAAACDLRFAEEGARFAVTPAKLGVVYPAGATARLSRLVGPSTAKYLLFSSEFVDAGHALRVGLVDEVSPAGALGDRVAQFAATLASRSQLTLRAAKEITDAASAGLPVEALGRVWQERAAEGPDRAEGVAAFVERRAPRFTWPVGDDTRG